MELTRMKMEQTSLAEPLLGGEQMSADSNSDVPLRRADNFGIRSRLEVKREEQPASARAEVPGAKQLRGIDIIRSMSPATSPRSHTPVSIERATPTPLLSRTIPSRHHFHKLVPDGLQPNPPAMFTWDYAFVFKIGSATKKVKVKDAGNRLVVTQEHLFRNITASTLNKLIDAGLELDLYLSVQKDEIYCLVGASEARLMEEAARINYDLALDPTKCLEYAKALNLLLAKRTGQVSTIPATAWENLYGEYQLAESNTAWKQELYQRYNTHSRDHPRFNSLFSMNDRLKLTLSIIEGDQKTGGAEISVAHVAKSNHNPLVACFPIHEPHPISNLQSKWYHWRATWTSPLTDIRNYFGEQIAFYFAFLASYNQQLLWPAVVGMIILIWQLAAKRIDIPVLPVFSVFVALWATVFLERWKRKEAVHRMEWGMIDFLKEEQTRPEFKGEWRASPVDGRLVEDFPWRKRFLRSLLSQTVIWTLIVCVLAAVISIFFLRSVLKEYSWGTTVTSLVNAVQIAVLNVIYSKIAEGLNSYENHRTETQFENALISKTFLFKFINSYFSLFYVAFYQQYDSISGGCPDDPDCLFTLRQQLGTIFGTQIVVANVIQLVVPSILRRFRARAESAVDEEATKAAKQHELEEEQLAAAAGVHREKVKVDRVYKEKTQAENEYELEPYLGTFDSFDDIVIQFGFVTLFVVAFPAAPLAALLNNVVKTRVDAVTLCQLTRRPDPRGAYSIGVWLDILNIVSYIAVITNAAIICFSTPLMTDWVGDSLIIKAVVFVAIEHGIILLKFAVAYFFPDTPEEVEMHIARQEYINNVLIKGMEEDLEEEPNDDVDTVEHPLDVPFDWTLVKERPNPDPRHLHR